MCRDVTIKNNTFDYCGQTPILIKPENRRYEGAVHKSIKITGNCFKKYKGCFLNARNSDDIYINDNLYYCKRKIKLKKCNNVVFK